MWKESDDALVPADGDERVDYDAERLDDCESIIGDGGGVNFGTDDVH